MTTATKKREGERSRTQRARMQRKSARKAGLQSLATIFAERDRLVRRGDYEIQGQLLFVRTENGDIDFGKNGPFVGKLQTGELVLLDEWRGLPDLHSLTTELCDDCRHDCDACDAKGKRLCMHMHCGGEGRLILSYDPCPAPGCVRATGKAKRDCPQCGGGGQVPGQTQPCPECKGTKQQTCPQCQGSGRMATGRLNGAAIPKIGEPAIPYCATCNGTGRKLKREKQDFKEYVLGELEGFTCLGPINGLVWKADQMRDPEQGFEMCRIEPDKSGNLAALLVMKPQQIGQPMYLLGGRPIVELLK